MNSKEKATTVFISYAHDDDTHRKNVLELSNRLLDEGLDCWIDRYVEGSSPERGWPAWMEEKVRTSDFVLVVSSPKYLARFEGREVDGKGLGGKFESILIVDNIYLNDTKNKKFIPIFFGEEASQYTITPLKTATYYDAEEPEGYHNLYRRLTNQPKITRPPVGKVVRFDDPPPILKPEHLILESTSGPQAVDFEKIALTSPDINEFTKQMNPGIKIVHAFFGLGFSKRLEIAKALGLLETGESIKADNPTQLSTDILNRAKRKGLLAELWQKLFDENIDPNPFKD